MNKIRIIDLLNKIANGEEVPTFKYNNHKWKYLDNEAWFLDIEDNSNARNIIYLCDLDDEVEIIETPIAINAEEMQELGVTELYKENKKIEKLKIKTGDIKIEDVGIIALEMADENRHKLNELIDYINKE